MADTPGSHIVEIRAGTSQRPVLELRPGEVVQPMSIGRVGMWAVEAPGVLDVHAYVYFDGRALFVQSADPSNPAKGNGQAIGTTWQQIEIPCTIEIGRARLVYRTLDEMEEDDEDKTVAQAIQIPKQPPPQFQAGGGAFSNREKRGPDSDATRLAPMPAMREPDPTVVNPLEVGTPMGGVPKARPAAGMPAWSTSSDGMPNSSPTQIGAPPAPPPPQNSGYQAFGSVQVAVPPPPAAPGPMNPMMQTLQAPIQSPVQPPMQQLMMQPGYAGGVGTGMGGGPAMPPNMMMPMQPGQSGPMMGMPGPSAETQHIQNIPGELKGFARAKAEWNAMPPLRKVILGSFPGVVLLVFFILFDDDAPQPQHRPRPNPSASASVSAAPTVSTAPTTSATATSTATSTMPTSTATAPTVSATTSATAPIPSATVSTLPKGKRTQEREAIDLVSQGQYAKAAEIYDQLAQQHPEQPAFREAARLLRLRTNGN